jgi:GNAT superfamily N-acetyltransferase
MPRGLRLEEGEETQMKNLHIVFEPYASDTLKQFVINGVDNHNIAAAGDSAYYPVALFLKDEREEVLGGLLGQIWGRWLHVTYLWVAEPARKKGNATKLMTAAEQYAVERGCIGVFLDTFSFQARPLYEKLGYEVFGVLEDHPPGHSQFFMKKRLAA